MVALFLWHFERSSFVWALKICEKQGNVSKGSDEVVKVILRIMRIKSLPRDKDFYWASIFD